MPSLLVRKLFLRAAALALAAAAPVRAQDAGSATHPRILGVADAALYVHDLALSRQFYGDFLGFAEPFTLKNPDGSVHLTWFKINDRQSIELFPETAPKTDRLSHVAFETDDAEALRLALQAKGIAVPAALPPSRIGTAHFTVHDPDGHILEFIQYPPGSWIARDFGQHLPATRVSVHLTHVGIMVRHLDAALKFYRDTLGFTEVWRGSGNGKTLSWVSLRVPDGTDWIEFMLYGQQPSLAKIGVNHHLGLVVPDVAAAAAMLRSRPLTPGAAFDPVAIVGKDNKRQIHAFDPDGTRVEIMEAAPVDGIAAPSSAASPPGSG
jgi:catechol 2,3-dioxygenase-like lactoylglutathione lyase family enzyme